MRAFSLTSVLALVVFFAGVALAIMSPVALNDIFKYGWGILAIVGIGALLWTPLRNVQLSNASFIFPIQLWAWQSVILLLSIICFNLVLTEAQTINRLQSISATQLFGLLHTEVLYIGIIPWVIYAVVGVGLAYFCYCKQNAPLLHQIIVPHPSNRIQYFFHSLFSIINETTITVPFLFLAGTAIIIFAEGLSALWGWPSPLFFSARTAPVWFLIVLFYKKKHVRLAEWMQEKQMALGGRMMIYILGLMLLLLAYLGLWVILPITLNNEITMMPRDTKSILVGALSDAELNTRLVYLIIGWWAIWIPWMVSLVARYAHGYTVKRALLNALLVPMLFWWAFTYLDEGAYKGITAFMQSPVIQIICAFVCVGFIQFSLKHVQNYSDLAKGAMLPIGKLPKRALKKVMSGFLTRLIPYLYACYVLGWFPMQVVATLGALFMLILISGFLWRLILTVNRKTVVNEQYTHHSANPL